MKLTNIVLCCSLVFNALGVYVCHEQTEMIQKYAEELGFCMDSNVDLMDCYENRYDELIEVKEQLEAVLNAEKSLPATFTSYYEGDGSSTDTTSSGLKTSDFSINAEGWYTYQGKVVIAAATYRCLNATTGDCKVYNTVPEGYQLFSLYDEIVFEFNGKTYQGIVLDSCGAAFVEHPNEHQRLDIFVAIKGNFKMGPGKYWRVN